VNRNVRTGAGNLLAILLHLPEDMTGERPQNVDTVLFFLRINRGIG